MSVRKVYSTLSTTPTLRVLASLYEHDLDFHFVPVNLDAGEHKTDHFLPLNVPAFQDGVLAIFGKKKLTLFMPVHGYYKIMRHIAFGYPKAGKEHIFKDPLIQGTMAKWIDVEDHQFYAPASKLIEERVFKPKKGLTPNKDIVAKQEAKLAVVLDVYEERLAESKYLGKEKFTSADLTNIPDLYYLMGTQLKQQLIESRPHLADWYSSIMSRPAWLQVVEMIEKPQS